MATITLANLRSRILERVNMENSSFVSTTELNSIINVEAAELHDLIVAAYEDHMTEEQQFTVSSGNTINLSGTTYPFKQLRKISKSSGTSSWVDVEQAPFDEIDTRNTSYTYFSYSSDVKYRIIGSKIYFTPEASAIGTYKLWYVKDFSDLSSDGATLDYPGNWYEYIIAGSSAVLLAKEESDPSFYLNQKIAMKERISKMSQNRDAGQPLRLIRKRTSINSYNDDWDL